ncbi:SRPBCC family protein [Actinoalloteichus hymeniacidonis]|uniref:Polyketide cyclase / dehydrase family protein n=1 Tax=Actinoalloteichus hymeniacidonis TaxID=340345 RepID=A0AAC9MZW9_9PSEU|nr:SRPBCC family protein [Actinoalloteichus hymeniacidonis]AOS64366.1 polyketide cyclase / dehydrase family protein [Actinoalloteichus hymeniacidonis]MBB5907566.1 putative membrane protein [Actinoalloteichus hymeniacidonis]
MTRIEESVDVQVPIDVAYASWAQFVDFPLFMEGVEEITPVDDQVSRWVISIAGVRREFNARIVEQRLDDLVSWQADGGQDHSGVVTFRAVDEEITRIHLRMEYLPTTLVEKAGGALGLIAQRVRGDLDRFKEFVEADIFELFDPDPEPADQLGDQVGAAAATVTAEAAVMSDAAKTVETEVAEKTDLGVEKEIQTELEESDIRTVDLVEPRVGGTPAEPVPATETMDAADPDPDGPGPVPSQKSAPETDAPSNRSGR